MITRFTYAIILSVAILFAACDTNSKKLPSLRETYTKKDTKPFGANLAYRMIEDIFYENDIRERKQSFINTWQNISDTGAVYFVIARTLYVNTDEVEAMLDYVNTGNDLVISAGEIDGNLLREIGCSESYTSMSMEQMMDRMGNTASRSIIEPLVDYAYYYYPFLNYFSEFDSSNTKILGYNDSKQPNSLVYFHGKGKLFLQCEPRALSNYFLLNNNNYEYLQHVFSYTYDFPEHVYWDDYYSKLRGRKRGRNDKDGASAFGELLKHPPLTYAFWIALTLLALYILFGGKRVQRIIEQKAPNENTSLTFTETIGRLYLQKKDNKNIADKMVTYFNEYIRNTYFLNTNHINDDFIDVLSRKSGLEKTTVDSLYRSIVATQNSADVSDYQLLNLQEQIHHFYKNRI